MLMLAPAASHLSGKKKKLKKEKQMDAKWEWQIQRKCLPAAWQAGTASPTHWEEERRNKEGRAQGKETEQNKETNQKENKYNSM